MVRKKSEGVEVIATRFSVTVSGQHLVRGYTTHTRSCTLQHKITQTNHHTRLHTLDLLTHTRLCTLQHKITQTNHHTRLHTLDLLTHTELCTHQHKNTQTIPKNYTH